MGERAKVTDGYRADSSPLLGKKREGKGEDTGRRETEGEREKKKEEGGLEVKKGRYYSF